MVSKAWGRAACVLLPGALAVFCLCEPAWAQAKNPFSVGISEGGGSATGVTGWILAQQGWFEHQLSLGVRAARMDGSAFWPLVLLSFGYGVFHAAGPGHGKAVLASYMVANERAFRRGVVLSFLSALLQGLVAIALVGILALILHATAQRMKDAASLVEMASFAAIVGLGLLLVWRKGGAVLRLWWPVLTYAPPATAEAVFLGTSDRMLAAPGIGALRFQPMRASSARRFICAPDDVSHPIGCQHCAGPDPSLLTAPVFSLRDAMTTVLAAGLRPCSGAILVLVFSLAQGILLAGIASVLAMSLGVALTTASLATAAVFLKRLVQRLVGKHSRRGALVGAIVEFGAACVVLAAGVLLLGGAVAGGS